MYKHHKELLFAFLLLLFLSSADFASALEVKYPQLPFLPVITENSKLPEYISYFFGLGIFAAGILAVISFAIGAVQLIMSAENPENANNAKDRMKGSILGLVLTLSAFIILRTINPVLITPSLTPLGEVPGIFYTSGEGGETKPAPMEEADTSNIPQGFDMIIYKCAANAYSPTLLIWEFPKTNFQGNDANYSGVITKRIGCEEYVDLGGVGSFRMAFQTPGIYYCLGGCSGNWCSGYMSGANVAGGQLSAPFKNNVKSIVIISDFESRTQYGVIFHGENDPTRGGLCSTPRDYFNKLSEVKEITCSDDVHISSSADIFLMNIDNLATSGNGIELYSRPWGWNTGVKGGTNFICNNQHSISGGICDEILSKTYWYKYTSNLHFVYRDWEPQDKLEGCDTFEDCPGSIRIKGNYVVTLYSIPADAGKNLWYCQTFYKDVPNMNITEFVGKQNKVRFIDVFSIK